MRSAKYVGWLCQSVLQCIVSCFMRFSREDVWNEVCERGVRVVCSRS
jgi:hypothetical protein